MAQLSFRPSLSLPNSAPGFNPSHIAATNARFSGVPSSANGGFFNILTGRNGTRNGSTGGQDGIIGQYMTTSGATNCKFSGVGPAANESVGYTFASICRMNFNSNSGIFCNDDTLNATEGVAYGVANSNSWIVQALGGGSFKTVLSTFRQIGVPYFNAISFNGTSTNAVQTNLITGQINSSTSASAITIGGTANGNYVIGAGISNAQNSPIAAVMFSGNYMTQAELIYWAQAPWSYWYPDEAIGDEIGLAAIVNALKAGNLMTMGVG